MLLHNSDLGQSGKDEFCDWKVLVGGDLHSTVAIIYNIRLQTCVYNDALMIRADIQNNEL